MTTREPKIPGPDHPITVEQTRQYGVALIVLGVLTGLSVRSQVMASHSK